MKNHIQNLIKLSTSFIVFIQLCSLISPAAAQSLSYPDDMDKLKSATFQWSQKLTHYSDGIFEGGGEITYNYTHDVVGRREIRGNYNLQVWQKSCDEYSVFAGEVYLFINKTTRAIIANPETVGTLDLAHDEIEDQLYSNLFIGESFTENLPKRFYIEELTYMHGVVHQETFELKGEESVFLGGALINCNHIQWTGQLIYAGFLCGIGTAPIINCSINYYYEKNSGMLVYTQSSLLEYNYNDTSLYQLHEMEKELISIEYEGQPEPTTTTTSGGIIPDWTNIEERNRFIAIVSISGILVGGVILISVISRATRKIKLKSLLKLEQELAEEEDLEVD